MKIISIINQKGGVGKTATAVNLASGLARANYKTLLIDIDPQGSATEFIGFDAFELDKTVRDVLLGEQEIKDVVVETKFPNLHLLPANLELDKAGQMISAEFQRETILKKAIKHLGDDSYDFVVIDCSPSLGTLTTNAIVASNMLISPLTISKGALFGFFQVLKTVKSFQNGDNSIDVRLLITNHNPEKPDQLTEWFFNELEPYKHKVLKSIIRPSQSLERTEVEQVPSYLYRGGSTKLSQDYSNLTNEIIEIWQN